MSKSTTRILSRSILAGGVLSLTVAAMPSAAAHVSANADSTAAGSYALVSFGIPHGCDGSPTTEVRISIPESINSVTPTVNPGWDLEKIMEELTEPNVDTHGNEVTERVSEVVYTARTPLPADFRDAFDLSMQLPEDSAGQTLYFPTVQSCEEGETAWIQIPADGRDADELDLPSPQVAITAAGDFEDADSLRVAQPTDTKQSSATGWSIAALVVGSLALITSLVSLLRGGRRE